MQLNRKIRVAFLIGRLNRGGAERQLIELSRGLDKQKFDVTILTLYSGGDFEPTITSEPDINLICLSKSGWWDMLCLARLLSVVRRLKPDIIHGYMSGANEMSLIAGRACGARVVWGLRHSDITIVRQTLVDRWMSHAGALLSRQSDRIIANSQMGRSFHIAGGYCEARITVIPNGIDTETFSILPRQREAVRREWNVASDQILIGRAARLDPLKDYPSFLRAAAIVSRRHPGAKFACIGDGTDCEQLRQMALEVGIGHRMIWAGGRADMSAVYNALDICVSSSLSEGFPNAVAEPMACGTPCVVTDVGDSAVVVGTAGVIVPAGDPAALADGLGEVIANWQQYPRERVRRQIMDNFSLERLVASTEAEFVRLLRPMASLADSGPW